MFEHSTSAADSPDDHCVSEACEVAERVAQAISIKRTAYDSPWLRRGYVMQFREVEQAVLDEIPRCVHTSLEGVRILDIGCGAGGWIRELIKWGADPTLIYGIDTIAERIENARRLSASGVNLTCGNAACLAFPDEFFDLIMLFQSMCLMSDPMRRNVAAEALRVLKPGGAILWYDYRYQRPKLRGLVRPIKQHQIKQLFPNCEFRLRSIHPFPPLARKLAKVWRPAWKLLNLCPPIRTSYMGSIRKQPVRQVDAHAARQ